MPSKHSNSPIPPFSTQKLEAALRRVSRQTHRYENQIKRVENELNESLSHFRKIEKSLREAFDGLTTANHRVTRAEGSQLPYIESELALTEGNLEELRSQLPIIRRQVSDIREVYDLGRRRAQQLVDDLSWLNTEFYERWRAVMFTTKAPVSGRWKALLRTLFAVSFLLCSWLAWIAVQGSYKAYRSKLVWGERLMS